MGVITCRTSVRAVTPTAVILFRWRVRETREEQPLRDLERHVMPSSSIPAVYGLVFRVLGMVSGSGSRV